jgi:hypothetical protein
MNNIGKIIKDKTPLTVNSNKYISTVNSNTVIDKFEKFIRDNQFEPSDIAKTLAEKLEDQKSLDYYLILTKENPIGRLLEALSYVNDADQRKKIRTTKPIYFLAILRRWGLKTKFKR